MRPSKGSDCLECPRCRELKLNPVQVHNALSRRDNKTYICSDCGLHEAMIDLGRSARPPLAEGEVYNEHWLLRQIEQTWGEHGAHAELFRDILDNLLQAKAVLIRNNLNQEGS